MGQDEEGHLIVAALSPTLGAPWDGRDAVEAMRSAGSPNWRQMEWIGFYFELLCERILRATLGGELGPVYGNTRFDYVLQHVWDLKAHPITAPNHDLIVNDAAAFRACLRDRGSVGVVVVEGEATYDDEGGTFKAWHDALKGGTSSYEAERVRRGAPSRRRKVTFVPSDCYAVVFRGAADLDAAIAAGWANDRFQAGMRNSNGTPRPPKVTLSPRRIPDGRKIR